MSTSLYRIAKQLYPDDQAHIYHPLWQYRYKFVCRALFYRSAINKLIEGIPKRMMVMLTRNDKRFIEKPLRPYITVKSNPEERTNLVLSHYQFVSEHLTNEQIKGIYQTDYGYELTKIIVGEDEYRIVLDNDGRYQKEGEMTFKVLAADNTPFYAVSFVIHTNAQQERCLSIGGLQGPESTPENNAKIKKLTKSLNGLRPKDLMVKLVIMLANAWNVDRILAVNNSAHIYRAKRYGGNHRVRANYNTHWESQGATPFDKDFYEISKIDIRKEQEDISRPKRAMYRRRYEWMDELIITINEQLKLK